MDPNTLRNQPVLRLTLQSQRIDATTYPLSHTTDYSVPQFTVPWVEVGEGGKGLKELVDSGYAGPVWPQSGSIASRGRCLQGYYFIIHS